MTRNRLLIVDDEPAVCELIKEVAEERGFEVEISHNGGQFRRAFQAFKPSTIILDLVMPGEDGIELLRFLAEQKCRAHISLISGTDQKVLKTAARLAAAHGLEVGRTHRKPILLCELEAALGEILEHDPVITEQGLADAISDGDLVLHYQPEVVLGSGPVPRIESLEALVRWRQGELGLVPPAKFIPLAEETGLIRPLTDFVLGAAVAQVREWLAGGVRTAVAVNFPASLLSDPEFPDRLSSMLEDHDVRGSQIILEITESGVMENLDQSMETLTRLRLMGVSVSIDDFGSGYSSLVQLYRMPFNQLKIDRSFVMEITEVEEARTIVRSMVDLAHNIGLSACAEGVENAETMEMLRSFGCDRAQGHFFSPPCSGTEAMALLLDRGESSVVRGGWRS